MSIQVWTQVPIDWYFHLLHMTCFTSGTLYVLFLQVKPLGVIWGKFSEYYSKKNTIMFDDIGRNFLMNPQNGLKVILLGIFIYYYFFLYFKWCFLILLHCIIRKGYSYLANVRISIIFFYLDCHLS